MDMWVVAAATGAGYLAKNWQKLKEKDESFSGESGGKPYSRPLLEQLLDKTCHISKFSRRRSGTQGVSKGQDVVLSSSDCRVSENSVLDGPDASEMTSSSGFQFNDEISVNYGNSKDWNVLSLSSLPPEYTESITNSLNEDRTTEGNNEVGDKCSISSRRYRCHPVKPLCSLDSCLTAQLYKEHAQMEDYLFSPFPSPAKSSAMPLFVTDGSRIINRPCSGSYRVQFENRKSKLSKEHSVLFSDVKDVVMGVPPLPEITHSELPKIPKQKRGKGWHNKSSSTKFFSKQSHMQGLSEGIFIFSLGITLGVLSSMVANKREVNKLHELLKQTKSFVQDLQEELEMKDSLTVKELADEGCGSQQTNDHIFPTQPPTSFSSPGEPNESIKCDDGRQEDQKSREKSESMSKIEAELEAELERLEMNMKASSLERRLSVLLEVDSDFVADIVQGELRADMVNGGPTDSNRDQSGTSTNQTPNVNYAVSPRELSLRLHEAIQSRLEERITELETALENSQKRVPNVEAKQKTMQRKYSNSDTESSSRESPTMIEESNNANGPFFLNMSGDALDAYNEVCEEFLNNSRTDEEGQSFTTHNSNQNDKEGSNPSNHAIIWSKSLGKENGSLLHMNIDDNSSQDLVYNKVSSWKESILRSQESIDFETDDDNDDDEFGRFLIKEIVEKARQGSHVVLNAQRMLYSMDEDPQLE